ncbi:MAG: DUF1572 family protein [Gemmatimonadaceae bacterium]
MVHGEFLERSRYYLADEYPAKIRLSLNAVDEAAIWARSSPDSNTIGNLMMHLAGNIRQWIVSGVGNSAGNRDRAGEFSATDGASKNELLSLLEGTARDADEVLASLAESDMSRRVTIQGRETTVLAAIYHVVEHFAMHTGQIILLAKAAAPGTLKFYDDRGGNAVPLWGGTEGLRQPER